MVNGDLHEIKTENKNRLESLHNVEQPSTMGLLPLPSLSPTSSIRLIYHLSHLFYLPLLPVSLNHTHRDLLHLFHLITVALINSSLAIIRLSSHHYHSTMSEEVTEATNSPHEHDKEGDVVLVVGEETPNDAQKFRVSSKALSLASPVFAKLFSGRFAEGIEVQKGLCPEIALPADDPGAMDEIFRIVHFLEPKDDKPPNTTLIAEIATHANKYDCIRAVRPRMVNWIRSLDLRSLPLGPADIGCLLLSAFLFQDQESFSFFSIRAQKSMTLDDIDHWESNELLQSPLFPAEIESKFSYSFRHFG